MSHARWKGVVCAVVSAALFGLIPLFTTALYAAGATGFQIVCGRMAVSAVLMLVFCWCTGERLLYRGRPLAWLVGIGVLYALSTLFFGLALSDTSPGLMSTLYFTYPLMVLLVEAVVMRSRVGWRKVFAVLVALGGTVCIFVTDAAWHYTLAGVACSLGSALAFAFYTVALDRSGAVVISGPVVFLYGCAITVLLCLPFAAAAPLAPFAAPRSLLCVGALAVLCTVAPYLLYIRAARTIGPEDSSLFSYVQLGVTVVVDCVASALLPSFWEVAGCALIVLGGMVTLLDQRSSASRRTSPGAQP